MHFLYISTCARDREHKCAISFIQCIATLFHSVKLIRFERIKWASDSTVHSDGLTCFVSIESAVLNESFDMNDSVSHLLKQGLAVTYWQLYGHIYLSIVSCSQTFRLTAEGLE